MNDRKTVLPVVIRLGIFDIDRRIVTLVMVSSAPHFPIFWNWPEFHLNTVFQGRNFNRCAIFDLKNLLFITSLFQDRLSAFDEMFNMGFVPSIFLVEIDNLDDFTV